MIKEIKLTKTFKQDIDKYKSSDSKVLNKLADVLKELTSEKVSDFLDYRSKNRKEYHMGSGLILIYRRDEEILYLERFGSHTELFK